MTLARPSTILLDAGGIFYVPDHHVAEATAASVGFDLAASGDDLDAAHYAAAAVFEDRPVDDDPHHVFRSAYLQRYAEAIGATAHLVPAAATELRERFDQHPIWQRIRPGARDGLAALRGSGFRVGIVSNHDGTIEAMLQRDAIAQVGPGLGVDVEVIIDSAVVGYRKPGPEIFQIAMDTMGVAPEHAIYVGDMPAIDAVGARRAGIHPIIMDPWGAHPANAAYSTTTSLAALTALK